MRAPSLALRILLFFIFGLLIARYITLSFQYLFVCLSILFSTYLFISKRVGVSGVKQIMLTLLSAVLIVHIGALRQMYVYEKHEYFKISNSENKYYQGEIINGKFKNGAYNQLCLKLNSEFSEETRIERNETVLAIVKLKDKSALKLGSIVFFQADFDSVKNSALPGAFDEEKYWHTKDVYLKCFLNEGSIKVVGERKGFTYFFENVRDYLTDKINSVLDEREASIANALLLGDKSSLSLSTKSGFKSAGAMHVLAVSGLHVGILLFCLQLIFKRFKILRKKKLYFMSALLVLWFYALLTGASPSVLRATIMFSFLVVGKIRGHGFFSMDILLSAAICMLMFNPSYLYDVGFQLSFSAMIAISLFFNKIKRLIYVKNKLLETLWDGTALCFAAQLGTIPISLYYFHQFPNYFLLTNILLVFYSFLCMLSGLLFLSTFFVPYLSVLTAVLFKWIYFSFCEAIELIAGLPNAMSSGFNLSALQVVLVYLSIVLLHFASDARNKRFIYSISCLILVQILVVFWQRETALQKDMLYVSRERNMVLVYKTQGINFWLIPHKTPSENTLFSSRSFANQFGGENKYICYAYKTLKCRKLRMSQNKGDYQIIYKGAIVEFEKMEKGDLIKIP